MGSYLRLALDKWSDFHADSYSQLIISQALIGFPALYLLIDAAVRWSYLPIPIVLRVFVTLGIWVLLCWRWPNSFARAAKKYVIAVCVLLVISFFVLASFYDTSWDGTSYHLPSTLVIAEGWDPIYEKASVSLANVHANGISTVRAALYCLFGTVECAKVFNIVLLVAAVFSLCAAFSSLIDRPLRPLELGLVYALIANPVATGQIFTFYVDGNLFSLSIMLIAATLMVGSPHRGIALRLLASAIVLLLGAKLTAAVFALLLPGAAALSIWRRLSSWRALIAVTLCAYAIGTSFIGFRPYVTNLLEYGHLVPDADVGQLADFRPKQLADVPAPLTLVASVISQTNVAPVVRPKLPFSISRQELLSMGAPDTRIGGFGPFFALELCLSFAALCYFGVLLWRTDVWPTATPFLILALSLTIISAVFPEPWAARYVPFFGLVPGLLAFSICTVPKPPALGRLLVLAVVFLGLLNGGLAFAGNAARTALGDWRMRQLLHELSELKRDVLIVPIATRSFEVTAAHRLAEMNIPYKIIEPRRFDGSVPSACVQLIAEMGLLYCVGSN